MEFALGIDGGGTSCRAVISDRTGKVLGLGKAGAANILSDWETATHSILASAEAACQNAGLPASILGAALVVLGTAGANVGINGQRLENALPFGEIKVVTDMLIALQGALGHGDGVVGTIGTGSVYSLRRNQEIREIGGWGLIVGDQASGGRLGRDALEAALFAHDGVYPASSLTQYLMKHFRNDPSEVVEFAHTAKPKDFGTFAPAVIDHFRKDDPTAKKIIGNAVSTIEASLDALLWPECEALCLLGGLGEFYGEEIGERYRRLLRRPKGDALDGALSLAVDRLRNGGNGE